MSDLDLGKQAKILGTPNGGRILLLADIRGQLSAINRIAKESGADAVIHTGDFGFYTGESV